VILPRNCSAVRRSYGEKATITLASVLTSRRTEEASRKYQLNYVIDVINTPPRGTQTYTVRTGSRPPTASVKPHPAEPKREWLKKDEQEWLRIWLAWNELAIPETFWSKPLEVLMEIEGDPSFRDGSSKVQWRQWLIIYKDVLKVPWMTLLSNSGKRPERESVYVN
jgi:hypothetical protein